MKPQRLAVLLCGLIFVLGLSSSCARENEKQEEAEEQAEHADHRAADEAAIRSLEAEWSQAAAAKDLDKTVSVYADDGSMLAPGAPIATGKDAIRKAWAGLMSAPGYALSFAPTKAEAAMSGDLAYDVGTYQLSLKDKKGKLKREQGKYVVVWKKQADGSWKAVADIFNADE